MTLTNQQWKYIGWGVVILIIAWFIYKQGKKLVPQTVVIPGDIQSGGDPTFNPGSYTDALFDDIDCVFCVHSSKPYEALLKLSNSQMVAVWNDWQKRYYSKYNQNIIRALQDEFTWINGDWAITEKLVIDRYKTLISVSQQ